MGLQIKGNQKTGRNDPCPCGSKLKFKYCHGDPFKQAICNAVVREHMLKLIQEEQKKRGIVPYNYTCNSCGHGFDVPAISNIANCEICPKCSNTDIKLNMEEEDED